MKLPYGASEKDLRNYIGILNIVEAEGGDYSVKIIRAFAEAYLK